MKKILFAPFLLLLVLKGLAQTTTIQVQDTMLGTAQSWRDTCFGLLDKSATWIPSGYLLDYSLADSTFKGFNTNDTITESGNIFALLSIFNLGAVNSNKKLPTFSVPASSPERDDALR